MGHTVAVVVCAHTMKRLDLTVKCVNSIYAGAAPPSELVIVVDNNVVLEQALRERTEHTAAEVIRSAGRGASDARSTGISHCRSDLVAFIDDDAWAEPSWLEEIRSAFDSASVVGAGGRVLPEWEEGAFRIPEELLWVVGSTYRGHPDGRVPIGRPIGASMAARREALVELGGFPSDFGPGGTKFSSNEELALFTRLRERFGSECILYVPTAIVHHFAPAERTTWRYLVRRSWREGFSKALARRYFGSEVMNYDRSYVRQTLLPGVMAYLWAAARPGRVQALRNASMCVVSLGVAAIAYFWGAYKARRMNP
jgi:GT2 family glycosyltransferase